MSFEFLKNATSKFYEVTDDEVNELERRLEFTLPKELKFLYQEIGYGFINDNKFNANRIMDTYSVFDFRFRNDEYSRHDLSTYDDYENGKLIFFERNESSFLSIEITDNAESKIYYYDIEIATSLKEFFEKASENDMYFMDDVIKELDERVRKSKEKSA
jgi:hypothetical protein